MDATELADEIEENLRAQATPERALQEKAYLKSDLVFLGATVPATRAVVVAFDKEHPELGHDGVVALAEALWEQPVHERRAAAVELLDRHSESLVPADLPMLERLLRESRTWALVDSLAASVVGAVVERYPETGRELDRWATDDDFWLRRSAMLALLVPLRRGAGDFERFTRYADAMLGETEFFIRKAIGWILRDTARKRPDLVFAWLLPRAARASTVTIREAVKPLSAEQRAAIDAARNGGAR